MNKGFTAVLVLAILILLAMGMPAITSAVESFRTDVLTQNYTVSTGVGETTASVALSHSLWNESTAHVTNLASTDTNDSPVAENYTAASKTIGLSGLADNITRTIAISYRSAGLEEYTGADTGVTKIPAIFVAFLFMIPLALIVAMFMKR